jgi:hypothetical protein
VADQALGLGPGPLDSEHGAPGLGEDLRVVALEERLRAQGAGGVGIRLSGCGALQVPDLDQVPDQGLARTFEIRAAEARASDGSGPGHAPGIVDALLAMGTTAAAWSMSVWMDPGTLTAVARPGFP